MADYTDTIDRWDEATGEQITANFSRTPSLQPRADHHFGNNTYSNFCDGIEIMPLVADEIRSNDTDVVRVAPLFRVFGDHHYVADFRLFKGSTDALQPNLI